MRRVVGSLLGHKRGFELTILFTHLLSLVSVVLIARAAGPEGRGLISAFTTWSIVLGWLGLFSIDKALVVAVTQGGQSTTVLVAAARLLAITSAVAMGVAGFVAIFLFDSDPLLWALMIVAVPFVSFYELLAGHVLSTDGTSRYLRQRLVQNSAYVGLIAVVFLLRGAMERPDTIHLIAAALIVSFAIPLGMAAARAFNARTERLKIRASHLFVFAAGAHVGALLQYVNARADLLMLPLLMDAHDVGIYAVAAAPAQFLVLLGSAGFMRGLTGTEDRLDLRAVVAVGLVALVWMLAAPSVVPAVFGERFAPSASLSQVLVVGGVLGFRAQAVSGQLLAAGHLRPLAVGHGTGAAVFVVWVLLADSLDQIAWAYVASFAIALLILEWRWHVRRPAEREARSVARPLGFD